MSGPYIDLWRFRLGESDHRWRGAVHLLDRRERARYRQFACAGAAEFFAFRRAVRRVVLSGYLGERPECLRFTEGRHGKPSVVSPDGALHFSTSDTGRTGVVAVASGIPVGVDVERPRAVQWSRLAERILSPQELATIGSVTGRERECLFLRAWTGKEALVKAIGIGLDLAAFRQITLSRDRAPGAWSAVRLGGGLEDRGEWLVCEVPVDGQTCEETVVSVAAPSPRPMRQFEAERLFSQYGLN